MNRLPKPDWLLLQAVLDWVIKQTGATREEAAPNLVSAFRNENVGTRGRCRSSTGHDTQVNLDGIDWDKATVDWENSVFSTPGDYGRRHDFTDVEVNREDLEIRFPQGEDIGTDSRLSRSDRAAGDTLSNESGYTTPYLDLLKQAIIHFEITDSRQPKVEELKAWFLAHQAADKPLSDRLAGAMATIVRRPEMQGGRALKHQDG